MAKASEQRPYTARGPGMTSGHRRQGTRSVNRNELPGRAIGGASMPVPPNARSGGAPADRTGPVPWQTREQRVEPKRGKRLDVLLTRNGGDLARRTAVAELAEGIAHDLKNQLTVVAASIQLAKDTNGGERHDLLERAWRSAMRAARLMDDMLRYARGTEPVSGEANAGEALETAIAGAWGYCGARRVHLEMRLEPDLPRVVGSAPALRVFLLHVLRWSADLSPPDCHLVVLAAPAHAGVSIHIHAAPADGDGLRFPGSSCGVPAEIAALAAQTGAVLDVDSQGPCVWLRSAWPALAPSAAE